ncbi:hypothetical protein RFI_09848 [Reticulomyxa filosa]|uniref:Uncharacterized protein n=1 Tax=Reticulomyxa filosa TaxID=46433 RepID=X6NLX0_RETFI|nr:hypothetical protein RFI_09848 [Reticulomyxa filosa]|eukprot:ETO27285.1 hypothetical protein RFI_09848 [Reticulomyxa filosa]
MQDETGNSEWSASLKKKKQWLGTRAPNSSRESNRTGNFFHESDGGQHSSTDRREVKQSPSTVVCSAKRRGGSECGEEMECVCVSEYTKTWGRSVTNPGKSGSDLSQEISVSNWRQTQRRTFDIRPVNTITTTTATKATTATTATTTTAAARTKRMIGSNTMERKVKQIGQERRQDGEREYRELQGGIRRRVEEEEEDDDDEEEAEHVYTSIVQRSASGVDSEDNEDNSDFDMDETASTTSSHSNQTALSFRTGGLSHTRSEKNIQRYVMPRSFSRPKVQRDDNSNNNNNNINNSIDNNNNINANNNNNNNNNNNTMYVTKGNFTVQLSPRRKHAYNFNVDNVTKNEDVRDNKIAPMLQKHHRQKSKSLNNALFAEEANTIRRGEGQQKKIKITPHHGEVQDHLKSQSILQTYIQIN